MQRQFQTNPRLLQSLRNLPTVKLRVCQGKAVHRLRRVSQPVFLMGSDRRCDLLLGDSTFPGVQSYVAVTSVDLTIHHLEGGPELRVNDAVERVRRLQNGDTIRLPGYCFEAQISAAVESEPAGELRLFVEAETSAADVFLSPPTIRRNSA